MTDYVREFSEILIVEANAIERASRLVDPRVLNKTMEIFLNARGKVIVSGVGKSGDVGRKLVSTFNSTGTIATFLHPSDALHGDLGLVTSHDVCLMLSNSGETEELLLLLPHLKSRKIPIVAIVGGVNSTLARSADAILNSSVEKEACPLNLAPTTSTTVSLALGDALAMVLMKAKGLTANDFAWNHPAGRLGRRLTLKVKDLMLTNHENPHVDPSDSWIKVVESVSSGGLGAVNVVDEHSVLKGFITDGDLRRAIQRTPPGDLENLKAEKIMSVKPLTVTEDTLAVEALEAMQNRPSVISHLPVVDSKGVSIGLIRLHDLIKSGI